MLDLPVFETLLTIFMFGLIICGIVYLGYQNAEEVRKKNQYADELAVRTSQNQ